MSILNEGGEYVPDPTHVRARYRSGTSIVQELSHFRTRQSPAPPFAEGGRTSASPLITVLMKPAPRTASLPRGGGDPWQGTHDRTRTAM